MSHEQQPVRYVGAVRNAAEGMLSVVAALAVMAVAGLAGLLALGAGAGAPLSRLLPAVLSAAVGGPVGIVPDIAGGGLPAGRLGIGLQGRVAAVPLTLTFLGAAVLGAGFFRPLRRRGRPGGELLLTRAAGALTATVLLVPALAVLGRGTAELPADVRGRLGEGEAGPVLGRFGDGGALSSVGFRAEVLPTTCAALLGVTVLLLLGCVAARRTSLPRSLALSRGRFRWLPVVSALTGVLTAVGCLSVLIGLLAGALALSGHEGAARVAGALLLAGPNLVVVLLSSGLGASWEAGTRREQADGGGLLGVFLRARGDGGTTTRVLALNDRVVAGVPLWLLGLLVLSALLLLTGFLAAGRTPARTARAATDALLGRHLDCGLRTGVVFAAAVLPLMWLAEADARLTVRVMGSDLAGVTAALEGTVGICPLTGFLLGLCAGWCGSRLHGLRAARRGQVSPVWSAEARQVSKTRPGP
ncbi:streptophobe family protein [Streptomyces hygroscopicus]|uniref:streptophobe family protein n=1 Tax=Streptomyces hygroscopicus TaxID=1912 RepID=UPI0036254245